VVSISTATIQSGELSKDREEIKPTPIHLEVTFANAADATVTSAKWTAADVELAEEPKVSLLDSRSGSHHTLSMRLRLAFLAALLLLKPSSGGELLGEDLLQWRPFDPIPSDLGVAGPFTGVHGDVLLAGGGANFPEPAWENDKVWYDAVYAYDLRNSASEWEAGGKLPRPLGYGTTVSLPEGVICIGGNDANQVYADVFLLRWTGDSVAVESLPALPMPLCYASAAVLDDAVYVAGGQTGPGLETATKTFLRLDLEVLSDPASGKWEEVVSWPGSERAFASLVRQSDGLYLLGGRHLDESGEIEFLAELYRFEPGEAEGSWTRKSDLVKPLAAGTVAAFGESTIVTLAGADGSLFRKAEELKNDHPGFPKTIFAYDTVADEWREAGTMASNQVTTEAVPWRDGVFLVSGEVRPRVRTPEVWRILPANLSGGSAWSRWRLVILALIVGIPLSIFVAWRSRERKSVHPE
jgi:N-acetylneuraminic acid mutarotase